MKVVEAGLGSISLWQKHIITAALYLAKGNADMP